MNIGFQMKMPGLGKSKLDKTLSIILVLAILGAFVVIGHVLAVPKAGSNFTEFAIIGPGGMLENYPRELVVGQEGKVILNIANSESETVTYRVEVRMNGIVNNEIKGIVLQQDGKWEQEVSFVPEKAGDNQKVEFMLYKDGEVEPYLTPLFLWIDVRER